jgi:hypothetical protein
VDAQPHLASARRADLDIFDAKHAGVAELMDANRAGHGSNLRLPV